VDWFVTTLIRTPGRALAQKERAPISLNVALPQEMEQPGGAARVGERLMEARRKDPKTQWWPWVVGNVLGTDHLMARDNKLAIDLYKLNVLAYPDSADGLDSLADAYLAAARFPTAPPSVPGCRAPVRAAAPKAPGPIVDHVSVAGLRFLSNNAERHARRLLRPEPERTGHEIGLRRTNIFPRNFRVDAASNS
jgi:hypothetical protein